jgi:O-antigen ligase
LVGAVAVANVVIGFSTAGGNTKVAVLALLIPGIFACSVVAVSYPEWLVLGALLLTMVGGTLNGRLPGSGGTAIFPSDVFVALAVAGYFITLLSSPRGETTPRLRTIVLSWPLLIFGLAIAQGIVRGHERYGTSYLSQPARMIIYAAIAVAMIGLETRSIYRRIVLVFYVTTVYEALIGAYNLATGTSQTSSVDLSTGGIRALALTSAMFLAAGLVLALLNLELTPPGKSRGIHFVMAALATFGIVISLGRTTFAVLGVLIPVLFIALRRMRRTLLAYAPIAAVLLAACIGIMSQVDPSLGSTIANRFTGRLGNDTAVIQRQRKYKAALEGFGKEPVLGLGFGRPVQFISIDRSVQSFSGDPENSYIYVLAGGGYLALGSLLLLIVVFFGDVVRRLRTAEGEERALIIFGASFAFILFVNALSGPILSDPGLMLMLWIAMLLPAVARRPPA